MPVGRDDKAKFESGEMLFFKGREIMLNKSFLISLFLSFISAVFLVLSFPPFQFSFLAWFAFIPLFLSIKNRSSRGVFFSFLLHGFVFFLSVMFWIRYVTVPGMFSLVLYLAVYVGLFGLGVRKLLAYPSWVRLIGIPCLWVALEFIREHFLTGFGWAKLGESQVHFLSLIQISDVTGVYGISFLVMMVNVLLWQMIVSRGKAFPWKSTLIVAALITGTLWYGSCCMNKDFSDPARESLKVAVIQANIDLPMRWRQNAWEEIIDRHLELSQETVLSQPDLIVWPETSFPGFLWQDKFLLRNVYQFIEDNQIPVLFGVVIKEGEQYFNSAVLIEKDGKVQSYDKIHLVPYGEFIPFRRQFPFLKYIIPIDDFSAGEEHKVLSLSGAESGGSLFSVLICFEDSIARMTRPFVRNGAQFLVNISNDAWFGKSHEPVLHLNAAIFRSVENRRALVRASNTGVSAIINEKGAVENYVQNEDQEMIWVSGWEAGSVSLVESLTFYTKYGDVFALFSLLISAILCIFWPLAKSIRKLS